MNISQYEAFLKTIEVGSLTKAADALGYTQSGMSHILNALEADCGLKLLVRERSGVRITSDGLQLLPYFESICNTQKNLAMKIKEIHRMDSGLIRVGTFNSVSAQWLPGIIKKFREDYPLIHFDLIHGTDEANKDLLMSGRMDCAFVRIPADSELHTTFLHRDPLVAILPADHELASAPNFPIRALAELPYIKLYEGVQDEISDVFDLHGITPNVQFIESDDYSVISMVEKGLGFSIVPGLVIKGTNRKVVVKELEIPAFRDLGIAVKEKIMVSFSTEKFLSYVLNWISEEYPPIKGLE